jgi:hypothetical protein
MSTIAQKVNEAMKWRAEAVALGSQLSTAMEQLGIADLEAYAYVSWDYDAAAGRQTVSITIQPEHAPGVGRLAMQLTDTTPLLGHIASKILPNVGKFIKGFDEQRNRLTLTATYNGIKIILTDEPPNTCHVEKVIEEVVVPERVIPEHTEKRVRYQLSGDCDPIMEGVVTELEEESDGPDPHDMAVETEMELEARDERER